MNRWDRFPYWTPAPKQPPPAHGIKIKKAGTTWWGQRWIEALEQVLGGDSRRLARGRTYARAGRTHDLTVTGRKVTAKVTGSRPTPYAVTIELAALGDAAWQRAIAGMAAKAQFAAELLAGSMPQAIDEVFRAAGTSLFPERRAELTTSCSCPDWGDPCKHVAAAHYVLGEALDRDPFLLFELRGKTKTEVLDALRAARGGQASAASKSRAREGAANAPALAASEIPTVKLSKLRPSDYEKPRAALPVLTFSFDEPVTHGALLRQLGVPAAWQGGETPADVFAPLVRAAAENARRLAMAEPSDPEPAPPPGAAKASPRRRETKRPHAPKKASRSRRRR